MGRRTGAALLLILPLLQVAGANASPDVARDFVITQYTHGVPYEDAHALGESALPQLEAMLHDPLMKPHWSTIVTTIAYVGKARSFQVLKDFMWKRFEGTVDDTTWRALLNTPNVMGVIPDGPGAAVSSYLEKGTNPAFWDGLPWKDSYHGPHGDLGIMLSKVSINGLACTGTKHAATALAALKTKPYSPRQLPNIVEGLSINEEVAKRGVVAYMRARRTGEFDQKHEGAK
jgi:hypothetical protein